MKKISIFLCIFWMGFIFYMSSNNGEESHQKSNKVADFVENTKEKIQDKIGKNAETNKPTISNQKAIEDKLDHIVRKNAHGLMYMVLAILVSNSFFIYNKKGRNAIIYILFICLFYAVTDEFHQSFVPGRTSLVSDVLIDFAGALIGLVTFYFVYYNMPRRLQSSKKKRA